MLKLGRLYNIQCIYVLHAYNPVNADDVNEKRNIFCISQTSPDVFLRYLHVNFPDFVNHVSQFLKSVFVRFC